jgi:hypothetical protein
MSQLDTKAIILCKNGIILLIKMHPESAKSDLRSGVWKRERKTIFQHQEVLPV